LTEIRRRYLLASVNPLFTWVRLAQRVPVRITAIPYWAPAMGAVPRRRFVRRP
jgi:hypothetical protein